MSLVRICWRSTDRRSGEEDAAPAIEVVGCYRAVLQFESECCLDQLRRNLEQSHNAEDYKWFIANVILKEGEVTVAEDEAGIVAFRARQGEEVRLLYTRPDRIGMGAGIECGKGHRDRRARTVVLPGK
jgi:hypothetical protein